MKKEKIQRVQALLQAEKIDGWLLYDFQKKNLLAIEFLEIPATQFLSRRLFYWIPAHGEPVKIVNAIESHVLDALPGKSISYFAWKTLEDILKSLLKDATRVAMEYSPRGAIPSISLVDAGTIDLVREMGPQVVSSSRLMQEFTALLTLDERASHLESARILDEAVASAWEFLAQRLKNQSAVTEYDVQQHIVSKLEKEGFICEGGPICAVNENSSDPHYVPTKEKHKEIRKGDFVLIDLWCKKNTPGSIYADICRVGVADANPTPLQEQVFALVKKAQETATEFVRQRVKEKKTFCGWEVDKAARDVIELGGFGEYFVHRTGHNIHKQDHGPGTHMDSLETFDDRQVLSRSCFSIEPGIYLPGKFGVRLEYDVFISEKGDVEISGGIQTEIKRLF